MMSLMPWLKVLNKNYEVTKSFPKLEIRTFQFPFQFQWKVVERNKLWRECPNKIWFVVNSQRIFISPTFELGSNCIKLFFAFLYVSSSVQGTYTLSGIYLMSRNLRMCPSTWTVSIISFFNLEYHLASMASIIGVLLQEYS